MDEILGLPANVTTAIILIVTAVIIPGITALINYPGLRSSYKRLVPIVLAVIAAIIIVWLRAGGPFVEQFYTWIITAAIIIGIAQSVYSAMPDAWKALEATAGRRGHEVESIRKEE